MHLPDKLQQAQRLPFHVVLYDDKCIVSRGEYEFTPPCEAMVYTPNVHTKTILFYIQCLICVTLLLNAKQYYLTSNFFKKWLAKILRKLTFLIF